MENGIDIPYILLYSPVLMVTPPDQVMVHGVALWWWKGCCTCIVWSSTAKKKYSIV